MEKNATINSRLKDLLDVMDARAMVNIFVERDGAQESVKYLKVYEFISEPELMRKYKNYEVVGLCCGLTTSILIKEA
jgi:hypothetical protein